MYGLEVGISCNLFGLHKNRKIRRKHRKNEYIAEWKAHMHIRKLNWYVSIITYVFRNQKRNCSEHERFQKSSRLNFQASKLNLFLNPTSHSSQSLLRVLFWLRKTYVIVEMYQFVCLCPSSSFFFGKVSSFFSYFCVLCTSVLST